MRQKKKTNNSGFTLIELLVSIAILAVVTIPLMHSFVTAARTNLKSRRILEATTVGQNIMENIKVDSTAKFESEPWHKGTDAAGNDFYYQDQTPGTTVNGREFYVRAYLDAKEFTKPDAEPDNRATDYNSLLWANMSNLSKANNAFLIMKANEADLVAADMCAQLPPGAPVNAVDVRQGLRRDITLSLSHDESTGLSIVKASAKYSYTYGAKTYEYLAMDRQEIYNNGTNLGNALSGLFICYYPLYNNGGGSVNETVKIENPANYPIDVYLVKQEGGLKNPTYALQLDIEEDAAALSAGVSVTNVVTNLDYAAGNLNSELRLSYASGVTPGKLWYGSKGLEKGESANRIYTVRLEVYERKEGGAYEAKDLLTEMESTKIE